eukprot:TRINITY_DN58278_c0_g1_i1.p1 TRINITY_DN58278_c0_g1~~TRINITY_DN58278_c0_g1_i1.p1  ORF type:complete len:362 (+),score=36.36 TRINITY_DN58278_c0_g1_i1:86-1171(+)
MSAPLATEADRECRLCFEGGEGLIAPCACAGSTRWVHRACLNQWRYHGQTTNRKAMTECPTCKYQYQLYVTFDTGEDERRRKFHGLVAARFGVGFFVPLALSAGIGVVLSLLDMNGFLVKMVGGINDTVLHHDHPIAGFLKQHLFLYWSAGLLLTFFMVGVGTVLFLAFAPCCGCGRRADDVARRVPAPGPGSCCDDCCSACAYSYACDPMGDVYCCADCESLIACEGDAALLCIGLAVVALIVFGIFIALVFMAGAVKTAGENYIRILYLKDVAEHFAVVDRSCEGAGADATCVPSMHNMNSNSVPCSRATSNMSQVEIHQMLEAELRAARAGAGPDEGDEENGQDRGGEQRQARDVVFR